MADFVKKHEILSGCRNLLVILHPIYKYKKIGY